MTVARNTSWSELAGSPWSQTRIAYIELKHDVTSELTWSVAVSMSFSTTPSAVMLCSPLGECLTNEEEALLICCARLGR